MSKRDRRKFSAEFKAEIVLSVVTGEESQAAILCEHELSAQQFSNWKCQCPENAGQAFEQPASAGDSEQIAELERMVGRLTMQLEIAKNASNILTLASISNEKWSCGEIPIFRRSSRSFRWDIRCRRELESHEFLNSPNVVG